MSAGSWFCLVCFHLPQPPLGGCCNWLCGLLHRTAQNPVQRAAIRPDTLSETLQGAPDAPSGSAESPGRAGAAGVESLRTSHCLSHRRFETQSCPFRLETSETLALVLVSSSATLAIFLRCATCTAAYYSKIQPIVQSPARSRLKMHIVA